MWDVLKEYPAARVRLEAIAVKRLEKYKKAPLEKGLCSKTSHIQLACKPHIYQRDQTKKKNYVAKKF